MSAAPELSIVPRTMRAAVMYDVDDIRIEERAVPALGPGDLLVRTEASGVCSGDLMPWYVRRKAPFVFGHEPAGTIVAIGADGPEDPYDARRPLGSLAAGDRVFTHHHAPCLRCAACSRGAYVQCATWRASRLEPGGMAEYYVVPRANRIDTLRLPAPVNFADGSLVEPLACVVKSLERAFATRGRPSLAPLDVARERADDVAPVASAPPRVPPLGSSLTGRSLVVVGAGVMGLMHVAVASRAGASVIASDFHPGRLALARRLGAVAAVTPDALAGATHDGFGGGADAVVCGPGDPNALASALKLVGDDGTLLMFTPIEPEARFVFDQSAAYFRDVRLVSSYSCGPEETRTALRLIAAGVVTAAALEATAFAFPDVAGAYRAMASAAVVKAIVRFSSEP